MPKVPQCGESIYKTARLWAKTCLVEDGSLFSPGEQIWVSDGATRLNEAIGVADIGEGTFESKLASQIGDLPKSTIQLCAEEYFMLLLCECDPKGETKTANVSRVLGLAEGAPGLPKEFEAALFDGGVATFGSVQSRIDNALRAIVPFSLDIKLMDQGERLGVIQDEGRLRELVLKHFTSYAGAWGRALLHMLHPDTFPALISGADRRKILSTFSLLVGDEVEDEDARLIEIERRVVDAAPGTWELYQPPIKSVWHAPKSDRWSLATDLAELIWSEDDLGGKTFDEHERNYKIVLAEKLRAAKSALAAGGDSWIDELKAAVGSDENNLTGWRIDSAFAKWIDDAPADAAEATSALWTEPNEGDALLGFLDRLPEDVLPQPGARLALASLLLLAVDPSRFPFYKPSVAQDFMSRLGVKASVAAELTAATSSEGAAPTKPEDLAARLGVKGLDVCNLLRSEFPRPESEHGTTWSLTPEMVAFVVTALDTSEDRDARAVIEYKRWTDTLLELKIRLLARGIEIRDLLDAQSIAWVIMTPGFDEYWTQDELKLFESFRAKKSGTPSVSSNESAKASVGALAVPELPVPSSELADDLLIDLSWLKRVSSRLSKRGQIIFYGPPGTSKTYVAKKLSEHFASEGGHFEIVQFHPSYTYEDFFQGYRPVEKNGQLTYELRDGVLARIAKQARDNPESPHLLVIDEINRGNIAKIFGELLFLLEYRGESVRLQYDGDAEFSLPSNLFIIGTMNTADRSIAVVDIALRRRFDFFEFSPSAEPIAGLLDRWAVREGKSPELASLLDAVNRKIEDRHYSLGPALLMNDDLEAAWEYSIIPTLAEFLHARPGDVASDFSLEGIRKEIVKASSDESDSN